ncbi:MAG: lysophospholipid acyltransferase family protein [Actinomycetota bacterium]|nr:lysophospholipid acyltransferase family protein [Actinomycetota bacterium]
MRVTRVSPGPVFADDAPRGARIVRRVRGISLEILAFVLYTVLLPVLLSGAAIVDLGLWLRTRKAWVGVRLAAFGWWFLFGEMRALATLLGIWAFTGGPFGGDSSRRRRWLYDLRVRWARSHLGGIRVLFGLKLQVEGLEAVGRGPVLIMMRHASIIDNMLPDSLVGHRWGMGLRFVIKRELQMIPTIDIGGRWVPTVFVRRASADTAGEVAALRSLAHHLGEGEGILIYPEGTRATPAKIARAKEIIAERQPHIAPLADRLRHLLPPRLGGPLALLDEAHGVDAVFCGHVGFDGFQHVSHIWAGGLVGSTIKVRFWHHHHGTIPGDDAGRTEWLYEQWQRLDDWVAEQRA